MQCRIGCAACCIAPSISTAIPGMPQGKPAGVPCVQLDENNACQLFAQAARPAVCLLFQANEECCGSSNDFALQYLNRLEIDSSP